MKDKPCPQIARAAPMWRPDQLLDYHLPYWLHLSSAWALHLFWWLLRFSCGIGLLLQLCIAHSLKLSFLFSSCGILGQPSIHAPALFSARNTDMLWAIHSRVFSVVEEAIVLLPARKWLLFDGPPKNQALLALAWWLLNGIDLAKTNEHTHLKPEAGANRTKTLKPFLQMQMIKDSWTDFEEEEKWVKISYQRLFIVYKPYSRDVVPELAK